MGEVYGNLVRLERVRARYPRQPLAATIAPRTPVLCKRSRVGAERAHEGLTLVIGIGRKHLRLLDGKGQSPLLAALGVDAKEETSLDFEARFPTGLGGTPPHLDVAMRRSIGSVVAVEAKFEALHRVMDSFHRAGN